MMWLCMNISGIGDRRFRLAGVGLGWFLLVLVNCHVGWSQVRIQVEEQARVDVVEGRVEVDPVAAKKNEEKYSGGASLKTNSDLEDSLKRASAFVAEKNYRNAAILWDRVLEKSENSLITQDGETYVSLVREVEQTIRNLPPNGLQVYRVSADGKARALMPSAPVDSASESLEKLVRLYFMSSLGDEAAYELGCRALDQRDFVAASRMFRKILDEHPDPSVGKDSVLLRMAIAAGNLGDMDAAESSLEAAEKNQSDQSEALLINVRNHLQYVQNSATVRADAGDGIGMRLGSPGRSGVMPDLPGDLLDGDLTQGYEFRFPLNFSKSNSDDVLGKIIKGGAGSEEKPDPAVAALSKKWKSEKWFPANQLLYANGRLVVKTTNDVVCIDSTGSADLPIWHSLWLNHFQLDDASWNAKNYGKQYNRGATVSLPVQVPGEPRESLFFFDRIHHSMATHNGVVFAIEGKSYSQLDETVPRSRKAVANSGFGQPINLTRSRTNYLTAYEMRTGKVQWTRGAYEKPSGDGAEDDPEEASSGEGRVGFLGTPVPFGNLILCPVTEGGAIYIYAMDSKKNGATVWKTFLCDDPSEGVSLFSPVEITIAGQEAYAVCGSGVLFALNAATGNIQFARRYKRDGDRKSITTNYNRNQQKILVPRAWDDDVVVAWRNALVVMASDHDYLFAIDRRTGKFLWDAPRIPFDEDVDHAYCLGTYDDKLFMATNKSVLCYNLAGDGKLQWYRKLNGNSYGRGFLTSKAVYLPVADSILKMDIQTGQTVSQVGVNLGAENKVGNIYSDGQQIWVVGINRVVGLRSLKDRLEELAVRIEADDLQAVRERLTIYSKLKEYGKAFSDIKKLFELGQADKAKALREFLSLIRDSKVAIEVPGITLQYAGQLLRLAKTEQELANVFKVEYRVLLDAAKSLLDSGEEGVPDTVLGWLGLVDSDGFRSNVISFLTMYPPSPEALRLALVGNSRESIVLLMPVVGRMDSKLEILTPLLESDDDQIQLAAARQLALLGEKSSLPTALQLLKSDDIATRVTAYLILKNLTEAEIDFDTDANQEVREKAVAEWADWLETHLESLQVKTPVSLRFGRVLIATSDKLLEFTPGNPLKKVAEFEGFRPEDVSTTQNGFRMVCEYTRQRVIELDWKGKEVTKISTKFFPRSARKLPNGNYLVAWRNASQPVVEIDAAGRVVWEAKDLKGESVCAERVTNGNTLITFRDRVVEVDANSSKIMEIGAAQGVNGCHEARRLDNGNTLVCYGTNVAEFDKNKNRVMRIRGSFSPKSAVRLSDGRTIVAHATGLRVFDKNSKKIEDLVNQNVNSVWFY
jgi:outer membrane protein assembly factor BamB/TolA-binding protein